MTHLLEGDPAGVLEVGPLPPEVQVRLVSDYEHDVSRDLVRGLQQSQISQTMNILREGSYSFHTEEISQESLLPGDLNILYTSKGHRATSCLNLKLGRLSTKLIVIISGHGSQFQVDTTSI